MTSTHFCDLALGLGRQILEGATAAKGLSLFQGSPGVALSLAGLAQVDKGTFGEPALRDGRKVEKAISTLVARTTPETRLLLGATSGVAAPLYALARIGVLLDEPEFIDTAHRCSVLITPERIGTDEHLDVMVGVAGALHALLVLHALRPEPNPLGHRPLDLAEACGRRLLAAQQPASDAGSGSKTIVWNATDRRGPLPGFGHGLGGITSALARLAAISQDEALRADLVAAALAGIEEEDSLWAPELSGHFNPAMEDRAADLRWCSGTTGVLLARAVAWPLLGRLTEGRGVDKNRMASQLESMVACLSDAELAKLDNWCCGNFSRCEALLDAGSLSPDSYQAALTLASRSADRAQKQGCFSVVQLDSGASHPAIWIGLAGISWTLLRLAGCSLPPLTSLS